jgi:sterol desaturase/sphingolipid hydroxylase (fatty acid hydroxylase superfamily)
MRGFVALFRLTRREYFADFFITPPLTAFFAMFTLRHSHIGPWLIAVAAGCVAWTFYEYALHRWGLHGLPLLRDIHALHHKCQTDYIAVPPWLTLASYGLLWTTLGFHASAIMVGFSVGYIAYAVIHTACHYARARAFLGGVERRHQLHHRFGSVNYGVSSCLWDRLFGTEFREGVRIADD